MKQIQKHIFKIFFGLLLGITCLLAFSIDSHAAPKQYTDLMDGAGYDETNSKYFHPEGDGILVTDYTLPANTILSWYGGNLTIASGVTLTISEGSCLEITADSITGKNRLFLLEEGATIRILGETAYNEYNAYKERLNLIHINAEINGTIESNVQGMDASCCDLRLNGIIHSNGPALSIEQCEITFLGGEYLTNGYAIIERKYEQAFEYIVEVYGGVFSKDIGKNNLADGITLNKLADGTYHAVATSEEELSNSDTQTQAHKTDLIDSIKSLCHAAIEKAKEVFHEAVIANGGIKNAWKNSDFIVSMIMVFGIAAAVLYCIYDFIRSPFKKKIKLLVEAVIVVIIVGGGFALIWSYVTKDMKDSRALTRPAYSENATIVKTLIDNELSSMNGLEAYGPGIYQIGKDIKPGVYYLESDDLNATIDPFYVYFSKTPDFKEKEIGLWNFRSFVEFENGWYITVIGAHFVESGTQATYEPSSLDGSPVYSSGEYLVGRDLAPGTYSYEPANNELFLIQIRDSAITAKEVAWSKYTPEESDIYDMANTPALFTVKEGQSITIAPRSNAILTLVE